MLEGLGEDPARDGLAAHAGARGPGAEVPHQRLPHGHAEAGQRRPVRSEVRRDGGGEGHRVLQPVRASHAAVLRQDARGLPAEEQGDRPEQDSAHRGRVRAPPADSGAADAGSGADHSGSDRPGGRGRDLRSAALLHDDARRGEAALRRHDQRHAGSIPRLAKRRATNSWLW